MVDGVIAFRKQQLSMLFTQSAVVQFHQRFDIIDGYIILQVRKSGGYRLYRYALRPGHTRSQYGIGTNIGAYISKHVAGAQHMQHKGHSFKFVHAGIHITRSASHPAAYQQLTVLHKWMNEREWKHPGNHLPLEEAPECRNFVVARKRMIKKESYCSAY